MVKSTIIVLSAVAKKQSKSDCEVVMNLIHTLGIENTIKSINGDFAMVYTDGKRLLAARDPVGVRPMFYTRYAKDSIAFASEAKALTFLETPIHIFPPGHFYDSYVDNFVCYHTGSSIVVSSPQLLRVNWGEYEHSP
jgi:asparagine synthase (glutamine-hydrolysing)